MVELRHHQRLVWEDGFQKNKWMRQANQVLDNDELLETAYQPQAKR
jgi:hypothetical protein